MKIKFDVTQEDINRGCILEADACMVTRCAQRTLGWHSIQTCQYELGIYPEVGLTEPIWEGLHEAKTTENIFSFDNYKTVKPFSFSLNIPDSVLEQIGYFEQKGSTTPGDYINENRKLSQETERQRHQMVKGKGY